MPVHLLKRRQFNVKIQAYSLTSRKIKKLRSRTPLICEQKIFTLELNASADAFVARRRIILPIAFVGEFFALKILLSSIAKLYALLSIG